YACRLRYHIPDSSPARSIPRRISDAFVKPFMARLFETECSGVSWLTANSNVTRRYMIPTFRREVSVIYPPVEVALTAQVTRHDLVTSVGAIQPNKRLVEIV